MAMLSTVTTVMVVAPAAMAEQRIVIRFDAAGHELVKHIRLHEHDTVATLQRQKHRTRQSPGFKQTQRRDSALVHWYDADGQLIEEDVIRHPGIVHVPVARGVPVTDGKHGGFVAGGNTNDRRSQGFYLLSGPDSALRVEIKFDDETGTAVIWTFDLP